MLRSGNFIQRILEETIYIEKPKGDVLNQASHSSDATFSLITCSKTRASRLAPTGQLMSESRACSQIACKLRLDHVRIQTASN